MSKTGLIYITCISLAAAVVLGAFGAHALRDSLADSQLEVWKTAVNYHFYHGIGMLVLTGLYLIRPNSWLKRALLLMFAGIILFSGSLYLLSTMEWSFLGPVTPLGGVAFILGWIATIPGLKQLSQNA